MAGSRGHGVRFPDEPFTLIAELERFRDIRNGVIPENIPSLMGQAIEELIGSRLANEVAQVGSRARSLAWVSNAGC